MLKKFLTDFTQHMGVRGGGQIFKKTLRGGVQIFEILGLIVESHKLSFYCSPPAPVVKFCTVFATAASVLQKLISDEQQHGNNNNNITYCTRGLEKHPRS